MARPIYDETTDTIKGDDLYFIQAGEHGPIKIGRSVNPIYRMRKLQTGNPERLVLLKTCPNIGFHEAFWHSLFWPKHYSLEWYESCPDLLYAISCAETPDDWIPHAAKLHDSPEIDQDYLEEELCAVFEGFEELVLFTPTTERLIAKWTEDEIESTICDVFKGISPSQIIDAYTQQYEATS